jgi:D-3-phosphoglycerate dehydrogenase / 2-oxoglutarate reductase
LALAGELVPDAVNVKGGAIAEDVRPGIPLAEKLGRIFSALAGGIASQLDVEVRGEISRYDVKVLELAALKGIFTDVVEHPVSYVNAPIIAADRGVEVRLITTEDSPDYRNVVTVRGTLADGRTVSISGTLSGPKHIEKLVEVDGFDIEVPPAEHLVFLRYIDRPGIVGIVGRILGDAGVNIGSMQVSRDRQGGHALVGMTVDSAVPHAVLQEIAAEIGAESARSVDLVESAYPTSNP